MSPCLDIIGRVLTFKKVAVDDLCQVAAKEAHCRTKVVLDHLSSIVLCLTKHFTSLSELFQLIWSTLARLVCLIRISNNVPEFWGQGHLRTWQHDRPWRSSKRVRRMNRGVGALRLYRMACRQLTPAVM